MYKVQSDDALLSLQIFMLAGEYEIVTSHPPSTQHKEGYSYKILFFKIFYDGFPLAYLVCLSCDLNVDSR